MYYINKLFTKKDGKFNFKSYYKLMCWLRKWIEIVENLVYILSFGKIDPLWGFSFMTHYTKNALKQRIKLTPK